MGRGVVTAGPVVSTRTIPVGEHIDTLRKIREEYAALAPAFYFVDGRARALPLPDVVVALDEAIRLLGVIMDAPIGRMTVVGDGDR